MTRNLCRTLIAVTAILFVFQASGHSQTAAHSVTQIGMSPLSPNVLKFGQQITVNFSYDTTEPGGVRIWARPMSIDPVTGLDMLTPNYAACGSPVYPTGSGVGSCTFTITSGEVVVDKIRIQMWDTNQTTRLSNVKLPVHYRFR